MPVVAKARSAMAAPRIGHKGGGSYRQPASGELTVDLQTGQEAAPIDHEHAETYQHTRQAKTERNDQKEAKADAVQGERTEQDHQRRWTRDDAAGNAQDEELVERNRLAVPNWLGRDVAAVAA